MRTDRQPVEPGQAAIVGMACVMPGAPDLETFWANIVDGVDSVTEVPSSRWDPDLHYDPDYDPGGARSGTQPLSISKWGGWIPDVGFDAMAWGIPPASLASIDPAQLLALKVAAAALDDAGYGDPGEDRDRTSLVFATGSGGASELPAGFQLRLQLRSHHAGALPEELDAFLPELTEDGLPGVLTSLIAGRVANRLDLGGKNLTVDSACASVLVALDIACNELLAGTSDTVLCGGVDLHNGVQDFVSFTAAGALSRSGRCRSFDADADGMTLAEGAGCIVLKRLADAERDGDRIYAVVRGVAGSSDGRHLGLTAPRQEGQVKAVRRAYSAAGISPAEIGLLEAHGTGTPAGDRTELATMTETFAEGGTSPRSVVLGTVKSNIGHIKCAAGVASLIKAAKAAYHGVLPPTLHITEPNEEWDPVTSPFVFLDQARPWLEDQRLVGVSAFGFGGTNFHAILGSHRVRDAVGPVRPPSSGRPHWPVELFLFRAPTPADLDQRLDELSQRLTGELDGLLQTDLWRLRDIAAAESTQGEGPVRLALVANSLDDLAAAVGAARRGRPSGTIYRKTGDLAPDEAESEVAFVFPEPDEARVGGGQDLLVAFSHQREAARGDAEPTLTLTDVLVALGVRPVCAVGIGTRPLPPRLSRHRGTASGLDPDPMANRAEKVFSQDVRDLAADGVRVFVTLGPGRRTTEHITRVLTGVPHRAVATDRPGEHGVASLMHALAELAVAGVPVDIEALHAARGSRPEHWHHPGRRPNWVVNGHCARTAAGESIAGGLRPAHDAPGITVSAATGTDGPADSGLNGTADRDPAAEAALGDALAVTEYLRLVHGIISTGTGLLQAHAATVGESDEQH